MADTKETDNSSDTKVLHSWMKSPVLDSALVLTVIIATGYAVNHMSLRGRAARLGIPISLLPEESTQSMVVESTCAILLAASLFSLAYLTWKAVERTGYGNPLLNRIRAYGRRQFAVHPRLRVLLVVGYVLAVFMILVYELNYLGIVKSPEKRLAKVTALKLAKDSPALDIENLFLLSHSDNWIVLQRMIPKDAAVRFTVLRKDSVDLLEIEGAKDRVFR